MTTINRPGTVRNDIRRIERRATIAWWRAGVTGQDRRIMLQDLRAELQGAQADGMPLSAVVGEDGAEMFRDWARERGVSGRAYRLWLITPAALLGILAGLAIALVLVYSAFRPGDGLPTYDAPTAFTLGLYASAGLFALLSALAAVGLTLGWIGDPNMKPTLTRLALLLPVGGLLSTLAGSGTAWLHDFQATPEVTAAVIAVVCTALILTIGVSRHLAIR